MDSTFSKFINSFEIFLIVFMDSFEKSPLCGEKAITRKSGVLYLFDKIW